MSLEQVLIQIGAPMLAKVIGQRFGKEAEVMAQVGIDALASQFGVEPTREAVEAAIKPNQSSSVNKVMAAEGLMPDLLLAQAEKMRQGNEQQRLTNEMLLAAQRDDKPAWTWGWLYVWQWVIMAFWFWTLIGVHLANAALRLTGEATGLPVPGVADLLTLTGLYLGLHMGGHTVLEMMRGNWGRRDDKGVE